MFKLVALILLTSVASITCTESPYDPVKARPMPDYVGQGSCGYKATPAPSILPGQMGSISFRLENHGLNDSESPSMRFALFN